MIEREYGYYWVILAPGNMEVPVVCWWDGDKWVGTGHGQNTVHKVIGPVSPPEECPKDLLRDMQGEAGAKGYAVEVGGVIYHRPDKIRDALKQVIRGEIITIYKLVHSGRVQHKESPLEFVD